MPNATGYASDPHPLPSRTRQEMEAMVGVEHLAALQAQRATLVEQIAPLAARYGPDGTWPARRKVLRFAKQTEVAQSILRERGKAPSEAEAERLAGSDPRILAELDEIEREQARYLVMADRIKQIDERIRRDENLIRWAAFEPRG